MSLAAETVPGTGRSHDLCAFCVGDQPGGGLFLRTSLAVVERVLADVHTAFIRLFIHQILLQTLCSDGYRACDSERD